MTDEDEELEEDEDSEKDMGLLVRKFKSFSKRRKPSTKSPQTSFPKKISQKVKVQIQM